MSSKDEFISMLPVSQFMPVKPRLHVQRYLFSKLEQVPLCIHGELSHSLISAMIPQYPLPASSGKNRNKSEHLS